MSTRKPLERYLPVFELNLMSRISETHKTGRALGMIDGKLLTRTDAIEVVTQILDFYDHVTDDEIEEYNAQLLLYRSTRTESERKGPTPGYVYVLKIGAAYKIGKTHDFTSRLKNYATHSQETITTVAVRCVRDMHRTEAELLKTYAPTRIDQKRAKTEWFHLSDDDIEELQQDEFWEAWL